MRRPVARPATPAAPPAPTPPPAPALVLANVDDRGVGLEGHDPVAFFTAGAPTPGAAAHASTHAGAIYWFASAANKQTFDADPARYAPRYGGYCAYAVTQRRLSPVEIDTWEIIDGKLLLFTNPDFHDRFNQDPPGNLVKADKRWPRLVKKHGVPAAP